VKSAVNPHLRVLGIGQWAAVKTATPAVGVKVFVALAARYKLQRSLPIPLLRQCVTDTTDTRR